MFNPGKNIINDGLILLISPRQTTLTTLNDVQKGVSLTSRDYGYIAAFISFCGAVSFFIASFFLHALIKGNDIYTYIFIIGGILFTILMIGCVIRPDSIGIKAFKLFWVFRRRGF